MRANKKLTNVVAGHTISPPATVDGKLHFALDDGLTMDVTPAAGFTYPAGKGGKIAKVQQDGTDLVFILADGSSIGLKTADASSSVVMKGKDGLLAYAGWATRRKPPLLLLRPPGPEQPGRARQG